MLAGLDMPGKVAPTLHQFAADALRWLVMDDAWPRYPGKMLEGEPDDTLLRPAST